MFLTCKREYGETRTGCTRVARIFRQRLLSCRYRIRMRSWPLKLYVESYHSNVLGEDIFTALISAMTFHCSASLFRRPLGVGRLRFAFL